MKPEHRVVAFPCETFVVSLKRIIKSTRGGKLVQRKLLDQGCLEDAAPDHIRLASPSSTVLHSTSPRHRYTIHLYTSHQRGERLSPHDLRRASFLISTPFTPSASFRGEVAIAMASQPAGMPARPASIPVNPDTLITVKVSIMGNNRRFKMPLRDLGANVFADKVSNSSRD